MEEFLKIRTRKQVEFLNRRGTDAEVDQLFHRSI